jgi:hypothetical protein
VLLCSWTCSSSFCVIIVSTVQLNTVQFVQYLYSKCAVLLCKWTCSSSFCVIIVSTVQLNTVQFVQYLYSKCAVLFCSWTWQALSVCEQQSAAMYIYCLTVWVSSVKTATQIIFWFLVFFLYIRLNITTRKKLKEFLWNLSLFFAKSPPVIPIFQKSNTNSVKFVWTPTSNPLAFIAEHSKFSTKQTIPICEYMKEFTWFHTLSLKYPEFFKLKVW